MGNIIEFNRKLKDFTRYVRNLDNSMDEFTRFTAITKAQLMLNEYNYDMDKIDKFSVSLFCKELIALLNKLE